MENKISTRKLLLTVSMALLLVVAVLGFGLFGINTGATSPEMGEIVAKADAEPTTITEVDIALSDNFFDYYRIGGTIYEAPSPIDLFKVDATKPYTIVDAGIFVYNESTGNYENDTDYNGFVAGVKYAIVAVVKTGSDFTAIGGSNASGYLFANEVTNVNDGWDTKVYDSQRIETLYKLPELEAQTTTISEIEVALSDNIADYYYVGGNFYKESIVDIIKADFTKPYLIDGYEIFYYDEESGEYKYADYDNFNGFVAGVKYAIMVYVVTGFDFSEFGMGVDASGYLFADNVTIANKDWSIVGIEENKFINALYELPILEAQTISEIDVDFDDALLDYYYIGGTFYVSNLINFIKIDTTKTYLIDGIGIFVYNEDNKKYEFDEGFNGFVAGVKYALAVALRNGNNASAPLFASEVTNVNDGWITNVLAGQYLETLYALPVLEAQTTTISEVDVALSDDFFDYYRLGEDISEGNRIYDFIEVDFNEPYFIDGAGIYIYDEDTDSYVYDSDFNGFVAGVRYAFSVYLVTGEDFSGDGGIDARAYLFANEVINVNDGWSTIVYDGQYIDTLYALPVLEAEQFDASELVITLTNELVYNGTAQTQNATIAYKGATLVNGVDYTISNNVQTNAGNYVMTITLIGSYDYTTTCNFAIAKATYDMSGISMANKTVTYNGQAHSLAIEGTLPTGVSVSYSNNDKTDAGVYTVTANFTGNANYNAIAPISATLTIKAVVFEDTKKDEETGKPMVKVESDNGFDPTTELVVEVVAVEIEIAEIKVEISDKEDIAVAYDVSLFQDGVSVQPNGIIRVKMLIPANLLGIQFRIVHIHNGQEIGNVDYTVDDNYAVIETDKLSAFVFIYEPSTTPASINPLIGWICLGVILFVALVALLIIFLNKRTIKFNANGIAFENEEFGEIKAYVGEKIKLPIPFAQGYEFLGWYYDKECTQKANLTKMGAKSLVLYAKWKEHHVNAQNNND